MTDPLAWLEAEVASLDASGLRRRLRPLGPSNGVLVERRGALLVDFGSNDYLGLAGHSRVVAAACDAAIRYGWGAGASPLVAGWTELHDGFCEALARFEKTEAAVLFPTGFAANLGTIQALVGQGDAVYLDRLDHACLVDGARVSGATLRVVGHNDVDRLASALARDQTRFRRSLIAVDGVYSMDGDLAPLSALVPLAKQFGAMLLVDEAHGTGVFGPDGRGACSEWNVCDKVPIRVGTLSKALGSVGGFAAGSKRLVDHLIHRAHPLIYSTSAPAACVAAAWEALRIAEAEPERRERARRGGKSVAERLRGLGYQVPPVTGPIVPVHLGTPDAAMRISDRLAAEGFLVPGIRPPTVPEGTSRLRIGVSAAHTDAMLSDLVEAFRSLAD